MLAGYDAWLTIDVEYEKRQEQADYCSDNHDWDGEGECADCVMEQERWAEGPDPDDINDRRREQQEEEQS